MASPLQYADIPSAKFRTCFFAATALLLFILLIYSNTFHVPWHLDDEKNILYNGPIHLDQLTYEKVRAALYAGPRGPEHIYRPVATLSFALNYYFAGDRVPAYHTVNLCIHYIASLFLFLFIHRLLKLPSLKSTYADRAFPIALLAALLWAVNPVHTQAVTYIVQRMASMAGMFYIISLYFFLKARTSKRGWVQASHYLLCFFAGILALGTKENAAMLPVSIFLLEIYLIKGLKRISAAKAVFFFAMLLLAIIAIGLILYGPSLFSFETIFAGYRIRPFTLVERLLTEPRIVLFYISLLFYPMPNRLSILHQVPISHGLLDPLTTILSIITIGLIVGVTLYGYRRWPLFSYCILFFFLNHIIESSIFPLELVFEHRNYLPSMLLFIPAAVLLIKGVYGFEKNKFMQWTLCICISSILIIFGHNTYVRNVIWTTHLSIWQDAVEKYPDSLRTYHNLARYYGKKGQYDQALRVYHTALSKRVYHHRKAKSQTHRNLATLYMKRGAFERALHHLTTAASIDPENADTYLNIGFIHAMKADHENAIRFFHKAIRYNPGNYKAHNNLGHMLVRMGRFHEAISHFRKAISIYGDHASSLRGIGISHKLLKEYDKALFFFRMALIAKPDEILTRLHLLETLILNNQKVRADQFLRDTLNRTTTAKLRDHVNILKNKVVHFELPPDLDPVQSLLKNHNML